MFEPSCLFLFHKTHLLCTYDNQTNVSTHSNNTNVLVIWQLINCLVGDYAFHVYQRRLVYPLCRQRDDDLIRLYIGPHTIDSRILGLQEADRMVEISFAGGFICALGLFVRRKINYLEGF